MLVSLLVIYGPIHLSTLENFYEIGRITDHNKDNDTMVFELFIFYSNIITAL